MKKVSICIPNYNYGKYIGQTIQSILNQTYTDFELIIVDDASTDNSLEVIDSFKDSRINVYENEKNMGMTANWNRCVDLATGDYITIFHSDDIYHKKIIEYEAKLLSFKNVHIVGTRAMRDSIPPEESELKYSMYSPLYFLKFLFIGNTLVCPSVMMKKEVYENVGRYQEGLVFAEDQEFYLRAAVNHGFAKIDNPLMWYRHQGAKSFEGSFESQVTMYKQWIEELKLLKNLAKKIFQNYPKQEKIKDFYMNFIAKQDFDIGRRYQIINMPDKASQYFSSCRWIKSLIKEAIPRIIPDTIEVEKK